jgi:hypothetical protein
MTTETVMLVFAAGTALFSLYMLSLAVREAGEAFSGIRILWPWTRR